MRLSSNFPLTHKTKRDLPPTQEHIILREIREGVAISRGGTFAIVLGVGGLDLALLDPDQREAKHRQMEELWRTLRFESQIVIGTRAQELKPYLDYLETSQSRWDEGGEWHIDPSANQYAQLLAKHMAHLEALAQHTGALVRTYHWVLPHNPFLAEVRRQVRRQARLTEADFLEARRILEERAVKVARGLERIGLRVRRETDEGIIESILRFYYPTLPEDLELEVELTPPFVVRQGAEAR